MGNNSLLQRAVRIPSLIAFVLFFAVTVSAYTVVMRGGKRVEIPSRFVITKSTLTYEVSPAIQVTMALAAIDIAATEKANNESPGSFLRRSESVSSKSSATAVRPTGRTITNRDLEASMQRRRQSELAYEARRKQLGLPSLEESRKQAAKVPDFTGTELEQKLLAEKESEDYWRTRASQLRTEIAALDAELDYVRARLDEMPSTTLDQAFVIGSPFATFGSVTNFGGRHSFPGTLRRHPSVFGIPRAGSQLNARFRFGAGSRRGHVFGNPGRFPGRSRFGARSQVGFSPGPIFVPVPFAQTYDFSYERSELITRFNELAAARAGLNARWRELEEEARRAGAMPGWLRR